MLMFELMNYLSNDLEPYPCDSKSWTGFIVLSDSSLPYLIQTAKMSKLVLYEIFAGHQVTDDMLDEAAKLSSKHYRIRGEHSYSPPEFPVSYSLLLLQALYRKAREIQYALTIATNGLHS